MMDTPKRSPTGSWAEWVVVLLFACIGWTLHSLHPPDPAAWLLPRVEAVLREGSGAEAGFRGLSVVIHLVGCD